MEAILAQIIMVGGLAGWFVYAFRRDRDRERNQKRLVLWREIADLRGGQFHEPSGGISPRQPPRIEVDVGPVRVLCDTSVVSTGQSSVMYTRVRGAYPVPAGPTFKVYRQGIRASLGKAVGFQDVVLGGDPTFDQTFMIKCDHPAVARQVWSAQAKELMLRFFSDCFVSSDERLVTLLCPGAWLDALRLEYALDLVGLLAGADLFGLKALQAVPGASYHPPTGHWDQRTQPRATVVEHATPVTLELALSAEQRPVTVAGARLPRPLQPFCLEADAQARLHGEPPAGLIDADDLAALSKLGPCQLQGDEQALTLRWDGIQRDPSTLHAGVRLLASLCDGLTRGIYR